MMNLLMFIAFFVFSLFVWGGAVLMWVGLKDWKNEKEAFVMGIFIFYGVLGALVYLKDWPIFK